MPLIIATVFDLTLGWPLNLQNTEDIMDRLGKLKQRLSKNFERYEAANERVRLAREAQAKESAAREAEKQRAKQEEAVALTQRRNDERHRAQAEADRERRERDARRKEEDDRRRAAEREEQDRAARQRAQQSAQPIGKSSTWDAAAMAAATQQPTYGQSVQKSATYDMATMAAALPSTSSTITYRPPPRSDENYFLPHHPNEPKAVDSPGRDARLRVQGRASTTRRSVSMLTFNRHNGIDFFYSNSYPPPITTTSPPPPDNATISYPELMSPHQQAQGYSPSLNSMFIVTRMQPAPEQDQPGGLLFGGPTALEQKQSFYSHPLPAPSRPYQPPAYPTAYPTPPEHSYHDPYGVPDPYRPYRASLPPRPPKVLVTQPPPRLPVSQPPPPLSEQPLVKASELPPSELKFSDLKPVYVPKDVFPRFLAIAALNTARNLETCGLLLGKPKGSKFVVTTLLIPKQHATSDTCYMESEELVADFQISRDLLTLGWVRSSVV